MRKVTWVGKLRDSRIQRLKAFPPVTEDYSSYESVEEEEPEEPKKPKKLTSKRSEPKPKRTTSSKELKKPSKDLKKRTSTVGGSSSKSIAGQSNLHGYFGGKPGS